MDTGIKLPPWWVGRAMLYVEHDVNDGTPLQRADHRHYEVEFETGAPTGMEHLRWAIRVLTAEYEQLEEHRAESFPEAKRLALKLAKAHCRSLKKGKP